MPNSKYNCLCLALLALLWSSPVTSVELGFNLRRLARAVDNQEKQSTLQPCPADPTISIGVPQSASLDSATIYLLLTAGNSGSASDQAERLEDQFSNRTLEDVGIDVCSRETVLPYYTAPELRSDCPYNWTKNVKTNRFPETVMEVNCLCGRPKSNATWEWWQNGTRVTCEEVKYTLPVLWRENCDQNVHTYRLGFDTISIACIRTVSALEDLGRLTNEDTRSA